MGFTPELVGLVGRSVQDVLRPALHRVGAAVPGPLHEPAGGSAQWEEDVAVQPGVPAHRSPAGLLGHRPAQDQDGCFPTQVKITHMWHIKKHRHIFCSMEGNGLETLFCLMFTGSKYRTSSTWGQCFLPWASVTPLTPQQLTSQAYQVNINAVKDKKTSVVFHLIHQHKAPAVALRGVLMHKQTPDYSQHNIDDTGKPQLCWQLTVCFSLQWKRDFTCQMPSMKWE